MNENPAKVQKWPQFRMFTVDPQGVATEVPISPIEADPEMRRMMRKWEEEDLPRIKKNSIGRLLAIAGLLIVLADAYFYDGSGTGDIYVAVFGFALYAIGRVLILRAAYEPAQRMQDELEAGASVVEKISHWF